MSCICQVRVRSRRSTNCLVRVSTASRLTQQFVNARSGKRCGQYRTIGRPRRVVWRSAVPGHLPPLTALSAPMRRSGAGGCDQRRSPPDSRSPPCEEQSIPSGSHPRRRAIRRTCQSLECVSTLGTKFPLPWTGRGRSVKSGPSKRPPTRRSRVGETVLPLSTTTRFTPRNCVRADSTEGETHA
jgi:hypothetical protein